MLWEMPFLWTPIVKNSNTLSLWHASSLCMFEYEILRNTRLEALLAIVVSNRVSSKVLENCVRIWHLS